MFKHHKQIINNTKLQFINDPNVLALIINGCVVRGSAGPESDFYILKIGTG
jgi:hypothetical protein